MMKKLMMAAAIVCATMSASALSFAWKTSSAMYGIDATSVVDNGNYTAGTTVMNKRGTWNVVLALYDRTTHQLVGQTESTAVKFSTTGNKANTSLTVNAGTAGATYDYVLTVTGTQTDLTARGKEESGLDYSAAAMSTTLSGTITTAGAAATTLTSSTPSTWTVSGITGGETPEPTSGVLMLLGVAGLALKRKRD